MNLPYKTALVTGSTGFIGSCLTDRLASFGITVHTLALTDHPKSAHADLIHAHIGDLTDSPFIHRFMQEVRPDIIFHMAAYGTFTTEKDPQRMIDVNVKGFSNLLDAAFEAGCKKCVLAGSAKIYPTGRDPIPESSSFVPWDAYAATKAAAEFFGRLAAVRYNMDVVTLRLSPAYGPGDAAARFVPTAIRSAISHEPFTCSVSNLVRNFTYIDDIVDALLAGSLYAKHGYHAFNIGYKDAYSFQDILHAIQESTGKELQVIIPPDARQTDDSWVVDITKAEKDLGWTGKVSLKEGIARTVESYIMHNV